MKTTARGKRNMAKTLRDKTRIPVGAEARRRIESLVKSAPEHRERLEWRVNVPDLFKQIALNPQTEIMGIPLQITADILGQVAARAIELNDPLLNALMCRLSLYECSDPYAPGYNKELTERTILAGQWERGSLHERKLL